MTDAQENYRKLLNSVSDAYKKHTHIHLADTGKTLYFYAHDRYGGCSYITLTEEQVVELARSASDRLKIYSNGLDAYIEDYDYLRKQAAEEDPETT